MKPCSSVRGCPRDAAITARLRASGFTLLELLVLVATITILAGMLLPALARAKAHAQNTACQNHLHQMGVALQMYVSENSQNYPYYSYATSDSPGHLLYWENALETYYPLSCTNATYHCPAFKAPFGWLVRSDGFAGYVGSYAYNWFGLLGTGTNELLGLGVGLGEPRRPVSESRVRVPSEMLALGDARWAPTNPWGSDDRVPG
jgi:type II secretory pathway pseudopilin PulG